MVQRRSRDYAPSQTTPTSATSRCGTVRQSSWWCSPPRRHRRSRRIARPGDGLDHLALAVPDGASLRDWAEHLTEVGIDHAGVVLEGGHPSLQLRDPDGIAIELVAP